MNLESFAKSLLLGSSIDEKLVSSKNIKVENTKDVLDFDIPNSPARSDRISFSSKQSKFPKANAFINNEKKALALHFFANHELLAIEMMAAALLYFPNRNADECNFKKGLLTTIEDEQKHFRLYTNRMADFGVSFGDFPCNDFFWRQFSTVKTQSEFYALVALTFEQANLDFALFYAEVFKSVEDFETEKIMKIVYDDEISHVSLGRNWLNKFKGDQGLWDYYKSNLPGLISPARAKGMAFDRLGRERSGLDNDFIDNLYNYRDDFNITDRKSWKK